MTMADNESGSKYVDRVKNVVTLIGNQDTKEIPTDNTIITVVKEGVRERLPLLYAVLNMASYSLEKIYSEINKCEEVGNANSSAKLNSERDQELVVSHVRHVPNYDDSGVGQWTAGSNFSNNQKRGKRSFTCWNCNSPDHGARDCPESLSTKARQLMHEQNGLNIEMARVKREYLQRSSGSEEQQKDNRKKVRNDYDSENDDDRPRRASDRQQEESSESRRELIQRPSWFGKANTGEDIQRPAWFGKTNSGGDVSMSRHNSSSTNKNRRNV